MDLFPYIENDALFLYIGVGIGFSWLLLDLSERLIGAKVRGSWIWVALVFVALTWPLVLLFVLISTVTDAVRGDKSWQDHS